MKLDRTLMKALPKVLLHEHLDGVLRPQTVIELADRVKYAGLPAHTPETLGQWFRQGANQGSLAKYLEGFATRSLACKRKRRWSASLMSRLRISKDGVAHFEPGSRRAFHTRRGLTHQQIVFAVLRGLARGRQDFGVHSGLIILRDAQHERISRNG